MKFSLWRYGTIKGFSSVEARKNILTGVVQIKYRDAAETWNKKAAYAECKPEFKRMFVLSPK